MNSAEVVNQLESQFTLVDKSEYRGQHRVVVEAASAYDLLAALRDAFDFDLLVDVTCVDYLNVREATDRFRLAYLLANTTTAARITVRVPLSESDLSMRSIVPLWEGANWLEREVWDMFGIRFEGHPDLRRILLPDEFQAHPLRKDYPLQGRGERHNFDTLTRNSET